MTANWSILWGDAGLMILVGLDETLRLSACALVLAIALGLAFGMVRWIGSRLLEPLCWTYVEVARNTPPVVQILFWYFSASYILPKPLFLELRDFGYEFGAAVIALSVYHGAFFAEVFRAGFNAIPKGQFEAARALGLGFVQSLRKVVLPQALRIVVPPLLNEATALIKNTSLAMAIGVTELTYQYRAIDNLMFRGIEALTAITVIYLLLCLLTVGAGNLVGRMASRRVHDRGSAPEIRSEPA